MILNQWARQWNIPPQALQDLRRQLTVQTDPPGKPGESEARVQSRVRLEASQVGARLWRNNVGVLPTVDGVPLRFGLCNDSAKLNAAVKSSDLVGVRPVEIQPGHVGHTFGQFIARECKRGDWMYKGTPREVAQLSFINLVNALGGDAQFTTGPGTI